MGYFTGKSFFAEIYGFQVRFSLAGSDDGSRRYSCSGTIGALASVVLLVLNARPVVSDERSEEFRRSVKEKGRRPTEATGSPIPITEDELVTKYTYCISKKCVRL